MWTYGTFWDQCAGISSYIWICIHLHLFLCLKEAIITLRARGVNPSTFLSLNLPGPQNSGKGTNHTWNIDLRPPAFTFVCIFLTTDQSVRLLLGGHHFLQFFLLMGLPLFLPVFVAAFEPLGACVQVHSGKRGAPLFTTKFLFSERPFSSIEILKRWVLLCPTSSGAS